MGSLPNVPHRMMRLTKTAKDGAYALPPLAGRFEISVPAQLFPWRTERPCYTPIPRPAVLPVMQNLNGPEGSITLDLRCRPAVQVRGKTVDQNGRPVAGVQVSLDMQKGQETLTLRIVATDREGRFHLDNIPQGIEHVWVSCSVVKVDGVLKRARPFAHVKGARPDGQVYWKRLDNDVEQLDFEFHPLIAGALASSAAHVAVADGRSLRPNSAPANSTSDRKCVPSWPAWSSSAPGGCAALLVIACATVPCWGLVVARVIGVPRVRMNASSIRMQRAVSIRNRRSWLVLMWRRFVR